MLGMPEDSRVLDYSSGSHAATTRGSISGFDFTATLRRKYLPTQDRKIPNKPLSGVELKEVTIKQSDELVAKAHEALMFALRKRMDSDELFGGRYAHPRVRIKIRCDFVWSNINLPKNRFNVEVGDDPEGKGADEVAFAQATERELLIDNPNLTRADAGLPFIQTVVERPGPDQLVGTIHQEVIPVDVENLPKPTPPVDTDKTSELETELAVSEEKLLRHRKEKKAKV